MRPKKLERGGCCRENNKVMRMLVQGRLVMPGSGGSAVMQCSFAVFVASKFIC